MKEKIRIGALISGGGTNLQAIIDACESGLIPGKMVFVGTDNPAAKGLSRADKSGIPTFVVDYAGIIRDLGEDPQAEALPPDFDLSLIREKESIFGAGSDPRRRDPFLKSRAAAESRLIEAMADFPFDLLVLAGFMRILTPYFIDRVNKDPDHPRIMNIHPALLPAFPGVDGYGDTFRYGCKVGGCTVHFVDYGEDTGPIIGQKSFEITAEDTLETVKKKGLSLEWLLYPESIRKFAEGRLHIVRMTRTAEKGVVRKRTVVKALD